MLGEGGRLLTRVWERNPRTAKSTRPEKRQEPRRDFFQEAGTHGELGPVFAEPMYTPDPIQLPSHPEGQDPQLHLKIYPHRLNIQNFKACLTIAFIFFLNSWLKVAVLSVFFLTPNFHCSFLDSPGILWPCR